MSTAIVSDYKHIAPYYDVDQGLISSEEIELYLNLLKQTDLNVLEVGCGTGRLTLPLARRGYNMWAIDHAHAMIQYAKRKIKQAKSKEERPVHWICADVNQLPFTHRFDVILLGNNLLWEIGPLLQQGATLTHLKKNLNSHGKVCIDTFNPYTARLDRLNGWKRRVGPLQIDKKEVTISAQTQIDFLNQIVDITLTYHVTDLQSGCKQQFQGAVQQHYLFAGQVIDVIKASGYEIKTFYGNYSGEPFIVDRAPRMIFVLANAEFSNSSKD
jgi:SAM-dependent methyltransferase